MGYVRYTLKTRYRDGTRHVYFNPLDFIGRLAALVPKPRVNPTRFARIVPSARPLRGPGSAVTAIPAFRGAMMRLGRGAEDIEFSPRS